jgi:hypothetical protein
MPFVPHTPESLLQRSDSKNPAATCRGLTSTGRLCRRAIAGTGAARTTPSADSEGRHSPEAYCWQHKDQAALSPTSASPQSFQSTAAGIRERTSVETLVERLGLLDVGDNREIRKRVRKHGAERSKYADSKSPPKLPQYPSNRRRSGAHARQAQQSNFALFCCIGVADEERLAAKPVAVQYPNSSQNRARTSAQQMQEMKSLVARTKIPTSTRPLPELQQDLNNRMPPLPASQGPPRRPSLPAQPSSQTAQFLSLIPHTASPQTSALLLAELAKPPSVYDEPGYIYIFWLTPDSLPSIPTQETASSLLSPAPFPSASRSRPPLNGRQTSSVLEGFSVQSTSGPVSATRESAKLNAPKTILLKIGRASNVQRRLNEWSRQCGYSLSLVRYYPYQPSSSPPSPQALPLPNTPLRVPNAHKIERLIHLELAHKRAAPKGGNGDENVIQKCARCGAAHREWFEVEASRDGVKGVDEVVRRWVDWGLTNDGCDGPAS